MSYITDPKGAQFSLFNTYNVIDAQTMVGQRFDTEDGREVVLVLNSSTADLDAGTLVQHSPIVNADQGVTLTAFTPVDPQTNLGASFTFTAAGTIAANEYQLGRVVVASGTGIGQTLKIAGNTSAASSATCTVTLEDAPLVALDTSSVVNLIAQPYSNVVVNPTTATASPAGVVLYPIAASTGTQGTVGYIPSYGFIQTKGIVAAISDATVAAVGLGIKASTTTAGTITLGTATGSDIGDAYQTTVSGQAGAVRINL